MIKGRLGYNCANNRYGLLNSSDLWEFEGLSCGTYMEVKINSEYIPTKIEMDVAGKWNLFGTGLSGKDLEGKFVVIPEIDWNEVEYIEFKKFNDKKECIETVKARCDSHIIEDDYIILNNLVVYGYGKYPNYKIKRNDLKNSPWRVVLQG